MMRNKRGDLIKNVLSLIIAVVGIALLIYVAVKLYYLNVDNDAENAKKLIGALEVKINDLKDGETGRFPIRGIEGWFLTGWGKYEEGRPDKCFFDGCICVCPEGNKNIRDICQESGLCRKIDFDSVRILHFNRISGAENYVNEEDAIRNFKEEYRIIGKWSSELQRYALLVECPYFSKNNLFEILIYRKDRNFNLYMIREYDLSTLELREQCIKNE